VGHPNTPPDPDRPTDRPTKPTERESERREKTLKKTKKKKTKKKEFRVCDRNNPTGFPEKVESGVFLYIKPTAQHARPPAKRGCATGAAEGAAHRANHLAAIDRHSQALGPTQTCPIETVCGRHELATARLAREAEGLPPRPTLGNPRFTAPRYPTQDRCEGEGESAQAGH